jgi:trehalose 6-phosphate phosphatase
MVQPLTPPPLSILSEAALLLDFDGTLVELAETPDSIRVGAGLPALIQRLGARLGGRLAIVSGRSLADLEAWTAAPGLTLCGSHGLELRLRGETVAGAELPAGLETARAAVAAFAANDPRLLVEDKPGGTALHFRRAPDRAEAAVHLVAGVAARHGLKVQHGKMVVELLPRSVDKGRAVARLMAEPPFAGARPVFVGDDLTDEHGFEAAAELGGGGVLVGAPRPTAARWGLPDVAAVHAWLEEAARDG